MSLHQPDQASFVRDAVRRALNPRPMHARMPAIDGESDRRAAARKERA